MHSIIILDLIQNPQGGATMPSTVIPHDPHRHSPRKRESTGRRANDAPAPSFPRQPSSSFPAEAGIHRAAGPTMPQHRHSGLDPESTGPGAERQHQPYIPSPLMGEESKVRVTQYLTMVPEGARAAVIPATLTVIPRGSGNPQGGDGLRCLSIVILDLIQNPQGGGRKTTSTNRIPSHIKGEETKACPSA